MTPFRQSQMSGQTDTVKMDNEKTDSETERERQTDGGGGGGGHQTMTFFDLS